MNDDNILLWIDHNLYNLRVIIITVPFLRYLAWRDFAWISHWYHHGVFARFYQPEVNSALVDAGVAGVDVVKHQPAWLTLPPGDNDDMGGYDSDYIKDDADDHGECDYHNNT